MKELIIDEVDDQMGEVDDDQKKISVLIEIILRAIMMVYVRTSPTIQLMMKLINQII
jgi:hypothetical protein